MAITRVKDVENNSLNGIGCCSLSKVTIVPYWI